MNVNLTPELQSFVQNELQGGIYHDASEVISAGLRRLKSDHEHLVTQVPETREAFEALMVEAADSLDAGRGVCADAALASLRRYSELRGRDGQS